MKLETMIEEARLHLHRVFILSKEENREELFRGFLIELHKAVRSNSLHAEGVRPTSEQRKQFIHKLAGKTFFKRNKAVFFTVTEDGKFQKPDGTIADTPSRAVTDQMNGQARTGWNARDSDGLTLDDHILKYIIKE